jgi:hypothetical protein
MILSENRFPLFGIMIQHCKAESGRQRNDVEALPGEASLERTAVTKVQFPAHRFG